MAEQFKAGGTIRWTAYRAGRAPRERTGTVWSAAMIDTGVTNAWWVIPAPEIPFVSAEPFVYVGRSSRRDHYGNGPAKGEVFTSDSHFGGPAARQRHAEAAVAEIRSQNYAAGAVPAVAA